jgi:hypothetical protein
MKKQATITAVYHYGNERSEVQLSVSAFLLYMTKEITRGVTLENLAGRERAVMECISEVLTTGRSDSYGWTTYTLTLGEG